MQDQEYINLLSFILTISMAIAFFRSFFKSLNGPRFNLDNLELFTITDNHSIESAVQPAIKCEVKVSNRRSKTSSKDSERPQVRKNKNEYSKLHMDCFSALKSLGIKTKKEQKILVHEIFNKYNPKSVQEFIKLAFMKQ